jgi:peptidoglycan-associated lipoprotein
MKPMNAGMWLRYMAVAVVCCTMMVGCKKCGRSGGTTAGTDTVGATDIGDVGSELPRRGLGTGHEDRATFQAQTVYYAYDSAAINPSEHSKLAAVADQMKMRPGTKLLIEGHCDERGTAEYNRALGERRALAAREALIGYGVNPNDLQTISYGFDRPVDPGHSEASWGKNRRAEFVIIQ